MLPNIDINHIPFSRYGAYVAIAGDEQENKIYFHCTLRRFGEDRSFKVEFWDGDQELPVTYSATPEKVTVCTDKGTVEMYIRDDRSIAIISHGVTYSLETDGTCAYGACKGENYFEIIDASHLVYHQIRIQSGHAIFKECLQDLNGKQADWKRCIAISGDSVVSLTSTTDEAFPVKMPICPEEDYAEIREEWGKFAEKMPKCELGGEFVSVTWFNLWSSFVRAYDMYKSDTMLMSKKKMSSVWSWDHCFNALTMAYIDKQKSLDQFNAPFVHQYDSGVLPDAWRPIFGPYLCVTKPPIHGWCFSKLMKMFDFDKETLEQTYSYLEKWTEFWLEYRDYDNDGIPAYPQGCDSGWDNSTMFASGFYMETPDLPSFLILQMRTLAEISEKLGNTDKKNEWIKRSEKLYTDFINHSWNGERFALIQDGSHERNDNPTSLLSLMPIVLGDILEKDKMVKLVKILVSDYLTDNGLATEAPTSSLYESNGYWRGPIWAPSTYLIVDGLRRGGYEDLAKDIALRYCRMSDTIACGNYENFDAITGKGLCAPGYTWSASVYMLFRNEY